MRGNEEQTNILPTTLNTTFSSIHKFQNEVGSYLNKTAPEANIASVQTTKLQGLVNAHMFREERSTKWANGRLKLQVIRLHS